MEKELAQSSADGTAINNPALGFCASADWTNDAVAGAVLRAQRHGYDALVAVHQDGNREVRWFVEQLGARIIELENEVDDPEPREVVALKARDAGYPGVIWQPKPSIQVAFEESKEAVNSSLEYCVEANVAPSVSTESQVMVALPAYNESQRVASVVEGASAYADEVLVVDDGSEDDTASQASEAGATVLEHETNRGYGAALNTAFQEAYRSRVDHLVILDADGQHDPADIPRFVRAQRERNAELVVGNRFDSETELPLYRRLGLGVMNAATNLSLGVVRRRSWIKDTQCGFRVYDRTAIESLATDGSIGTHMGASTDILHHAHAEDYDIIEVPTTIDYSVEDASTRNPVQHGITLIMNLVQTIEQQRPISAIGVPGVGLALLGVGTGYWTFSNFIRTGTFPIGLAITASFLGLLGILACFTAIILHSMNTQLPQT